MDNFVLSLNQIASLAMAAGHEKTYVVEGGIGTGKTSIVDIVKQRCADKYDYVVVDCTQWDVGDVQLPDADKTAGVMRFLPNVMLVGKRDKPMFIMLDEIGKASRPVQNALLPVMLERRVGIHALPEGSIVIGTTNLSMEGVGDLLQPHARNRVSFIESRPPTSDEWISWAVDRGVSPAVLAWVAETPQLLQSFKDVKSPQDNPYIFHPKEQRRAFVTPRSLYMASIELRDDVRAAVNDEDATQAAIAGNIGLRGALDLMAFVKLNDKTPRYNEIVANPTSARIYDESPAALCMTIYNCVGRVTLEEFDAVLTYIKRMPKELQALFALLITRSPKKQLIALRNRQFSEWVAKNSWIMS